MDGLFKKTMSYLNTDNLEQDEFVGKIVSVGEIKLKIIRKIAEGKKFQISPVFVVISKISLEIPKERDRECGCIMMNVFELNH